MTDARRPNWSTLRAMSSSVSNSSSSFDAAPQRANARMISVTLQNAVTTTSNTLNGDCQNLCAPTNAMEMSLAHVNAEKAARAHPAERDEPHADLGDHRAVDDELEHVEREPGALGAEREHDRRRGQRGHREVQPHVRVRVHEAVREPARDLAARERVDRARRPVCKRAPRRQSRPRARGRGRGRGRLARARTHGWGGEADGSAPLSGP